MGFGEAIRTCFRKYVTISGRASRSEYWWFYLFLILASLAAGVVDAMLFGVSPESDGGPLQAIVGLVTFIPMITATVRRLHDTGRPGYYILAPFAFFAIGAAIMGLAAPSLGAVVLGGVVMLLGLLLQLYWLIQKSDPEANRYGPNPATGHHLNTVFE